MFIICSSQLITLPCLARYLLVDLLVGVVYERADECFGYVAVEVDLVPMLLVPVPRALDAVVLIAQFERIVGLALEHYEVGSLQVDTGKYLTHEAEHQCGLVEGECLVRMGFLQAIFADVFDVHGLIVSPKVRQKVASSKAFGGNFAK